MIISKVSLLLNVPLIFGTFSFGLWGIHINYAYYNSSVQGSCNLSYIVYLITIDSVIAVFIAAFFCVLISYAIVSTRMNKLDFIMTILINILRPGYSLLLSAGLVIAAAVYYYKGQCVSNHLSTLNSI